MTVWRTTGRHAASLLAKIWHGLRIEPATIHVLRTSAIGRKTALFFRRTSLEKNFILPVIWLSHTINRSKTAADLTGQIFVIF